MSGSVFFKTRKHFPGAIKSPKKFRLIVKRLKRNGLTTREFRELNLLKTRARIISQNPRVSPAKRKNFAKVSRISLPRISRR